VLAVGGLAFSFAQDARQQETDEQRAQDTALQAYLDEIGQLLLDKKLQPENSDDEARTLARARTLTILERLKPDPRESASPTGSFRPGPDRKRSVLQFLYESNLINKENVVVDLSEANLRDADLRNIDLSSADLTEANLTRANLFIAGLKYADLSGATLEEADLRNATLTEANLTHANLRDAELGNTRLIDADLTGANLSGADLQGLPQPSWAPQEQFVTQEQVNQAWGDETTVLPDYLERPESWSNEARKAKIESKDK